MASPSRDFSLGTKFEAKFKIVCLSPSALYPSFFAFAPFAGLVTSLSGNNFFCVVALISSPQSRSLKTGVFGGSGVDDSMGKNSSCDVTVSNDDDS